MCAGKTPVNGRPGKVNEGVSFMPSQCYNSLAYGKLNEVGLIVDVQFFH